jgi:L-alanine-DL-glutamate epimerase-like enolase superfamily enzyme
MTFSLVTPIQVLQLYVLVNDFFVNLHNLHLIIGWLTHHALQIAKSVQDLNSFYMEQPCTSYEECLTVRKHTDLPFILDESVTDLQSLVKAWTDHAADVVNIKISKFGGITKAKEAIEFCTSVGIAMTIEDSWGG